MFYYGKNMLFEGKREEQAREKAKEIIFKSLYGNPNYSYSPERLNKINQWTISTLNSYEKILFSNSKIRGSQVMRLFPIFCKHAVDYEIYVSSPEEIIETSWNELFERMKKIINYLYTLTLRGENLSKISLNTSFDDLESFYGKMMENEEKEENERIKNTEYTENPEYTIVGPLDFETSKKYGDLSAWQHRGNYIDGEICYTQKPETWRKYTFGDKYTVYVILKDGWENMPPNNAHREPFNEYGLSMIFVIIDEKQNLVWCNTRLNHFADYERYGKHVDHALTKEEISKLIGRKFDEVFIPKKNGENEEKKWLDYSAECDRRIASGEPLDEIFEKHNKYDSFMLKYKKYCKVENEDDVCNFYFPNKGILVKNQWFDEVEEFCDGFAKVQLHGYANVIDMNGEYRSEQWFDDLTIDEEISEYGLILVYNEGKHNVLNAKTKKLISNQWFNDSEYIDEGDEGSEHGFIMKFLTSEGEILFLDKKGVISKNKNIDTIKKVGDFHEGFAVVTVNDKQYNFIDEENRLLCDQSFDYAEDFRDGFARVCFNGKVSLINKEGKIILKPIYDAYACSYFDNGFALIENDNGVNYINEKGELLSDQWFIRGSGFNQNGFATVYLYVGNELKCMYLDTNGKLHDNISENRKMKTIIISESQAKMLKENMRMINEKMSEEAFISHVKNYLKQLLTNPIGAQPDAFLKSNGLDGKTLLPKLLDYDIIVKKTKIVSEGKDRFEIVYKIPRNNFEKKILRLYNELFDDDTKEINESVNQELLAPNGKPSKLPANLWKIVRTPQFKAWFGDWENDPENASKVVDENGEPMSVCHFSNNEFNSFDSSKIGSNTRRKLLGSGFYFSDGIPAGNKSDYGDIRYDCFLNIKNPYIINGKTELMGVAYAVDRIRPKDCDGVIYKEKGMNQYVALLPNQIKSVNNLGNFSFDSDDINEGCVYEDGATGAGVAGATNCNGSSGAFVQPVFPMMRRSIKTKPQTEDINEEAVMDTAIGDFGYDAPPFKKKKKDPAYDHKNMMKKSFRRK